MDRFWMVWNLRRGTSQKHVTREAAMNEARRLAAESPGEEFYVLCATSMLIAEEHPVRVTNLDIPGTRRPFM